MRQIVDRFEIPASLGRPLGRLALLGLLALPAVAYADAGAVDRDEAFVDSVYGWGIWELGLEPVTAPRTPADTAINDRSRSVKFRPNENAAYMVRSIPVASQTSVTSPQPLPPAPPIAQPTTIGPPGFTSGAPTTADPRNAVRSR